MARVLEQQLFYRGIVEPSFGMSSLVKLNPNTLSETEKPLYTALKKHYRTKSTTPTKEDILLSIESDLEKRHKDLDNISEALDYAVDVYNLVNEEGSVTDSTREATNKYVTQNLMMSKINEYLTKEGDNLGDTEVLSKLAEDINEIAHIDVNADKYNTLDLVNDTDRVLDLYDNLVKNRQSTGFAQIDEITEGGIARGEVGVIIGSTGGGKSAIATQLAVNYSRFGQNVLFISLEESQDRVALKFDQILSGAERSFFVNELGQVNKENVLATRKVYKTDSLMLGNIRLFNEKPQSVSINDIDGYLNNLKFNGEIFPDVVVLDYPELMINPHTRYVSESDAGGKLYEDIRSLAKKHNFICWTLSQLNRGAWSSDINTAGNIEGSKRKLNAVELALTINQKGEEYDRNILRLHKDKVRYRANSNNSDEFIYLKFNPKNNRVEDESDLEITTHKSIVGDNGYTKQDIKQSNVGYEESKKNINNINASLGGI